MTTTTDYRVVTPAASVAFVQTRMGVAPGWGGARRLVNIVGRTRALDLMLSCKKIDVEEGQRIGYYDHVFSPDATVEDAEKWLTGNFFRG